MESGSCYPNPCGQHSICEIQYNRVVCSCQAGYYGKPPNCRPECVVSQDCSLDRACIRGKCVDPCLGTCGHGAICTMQQHKPVCSCPPGFTGNPFYICQEIPPGESIHHDLIRVFLMTYSFQSLLCFPVCPLPVGRMPFAVKNMANQFVSASLDSSMCLPIADRNASLIKIAIRIKCAEIKSVWIRVEIFAAWTLSARQRIICLFAPVRMDTPETLSKSAHPFHPVLMTHTKCDFSSLFLSF